MGTGEFNAGGNPEMDWHPIQGGVEIFLVASCHGNRDKLRPDGPLGSYADFIEKPRKNIAFVCMNGKRDGKIVICFILATKLMLNFNSCFTD